MENTNILVSLSECINDWIKKIKEYINKLDEIGTYHLENIWRDNKALLYDIKDIDDMKNNIVTYLDNIEYNYDILIRITNEIVIEKLSSLYDINTILKENVRYHKIVKQVYEDIIDKKIVIEQSIDPFTFHGTIVMFYMIIKDINNKKLVHMKIYKKISLNNDKVYEMPDTLENIKKINYYITPLTVKTIDKSNSFNINMSNNIVSYNVLPLFNLQKALQYGPIQSNDAGIDQVMIKRYENLVLQKKTTVFSKEYINSIEGMATVYTGAEYKNLHSVYSFTNRWKPLSGVNDNVYKYNELLYEQIKNTMKLDPDKTISKPNTTNGIDEIKKELHDRTKLVTTISSYYFDKLKIDNSTNISIKNEIYLYQYYNILDAIHNIKTNNMSLITVFPSNTIFTKLNEI